MSMRQPSFPLPRRFGCGLTLTTVGSGFGSRLTSLVKLALSGSTFRFLLGRVERRRVAEADSAAACGIVVVETIQEKYAVTFASHS